MSLPPIRIYRNTHKECWTIQKRIHGVGWRVVARADEVWLRNGQFVVEPGGRERTRRERTKNVHAYCYGTEYAIDRPAWAPVRSGLWWHIASYNPYLDETFVATDPWAEGPDGPSVTPIKRDEIHPSVYFNPKGKVLI